MKKGCPAYNHSDTLRSYTSFTQSITNQGNGSEMTFVAGATKINLKSLKTYLWLDDLMQAIILRHHLYIDGRFESLTSSGRSLTWADEANKYHLLRQMSSQWES